MTDTTRAALAQALDALQHACDAQSNPGRGKFPTIHDFGLMRRAAEVAQAALAAPQEQDRRCECCGYMTYHREHLSCIRAAAPAAPARAEPTDAEIVAVMRDGNNCNYNDEAEHVQFARAVLALRGAA